MIWKRVLFALAASISMTGLVTASAVAGGNPDRQPLPTPPDIVAPFCGPAMGDILGHVAVNREYIKTYESSDGAVRQMIEGYQEDVFTVLATGKTATINASGPAVLTFYPNGDVVFVLEGRTLFGDPVRGGLFLYTGLVAIDTSTGTVASHEGDVIDLCAVLS
jgi:hypothetical protein